MAGAHPRDLSPPYQQKLFSSARMRTFVRSFGGEVVFPGDDAVRRKGLVGLVRRLGVALARGHGWRDGVGCMRVVVVVG